MLSNPQKEFDTHGELLIRRYRDGITLEKPSSQDHDNAGTTVATLFNLPFAIYFLDSASHITDCNVHEVTLLGRDSIKEVLGSTGADFCARDLSDKIFAINKTILNNKTTRLIDETGFRKDGFLLEQISLKLPWYYQDDLIGLLGITIYTDTESLTKFAGNILKLSSTGLLGSAELPVQALLPKSRSTCIQFSQRESEIMSYLVRGKTAKEISLLLSRSVRTIEHHIANIKYKSRSNSKSELIEKFFDDFK